MEDDVLIDLALDGDDEALKQLHDRYVHQLFQYVYTQTGSYHDAEELIQDIFFKMAKRLGEFRRQSSFKTWLFTIGRNTVIDYYRTQQKHRGTVSMPGAKVEGYTAPTASAEEKAVQNDLREQLIACLNQLPFHYRNVLHLRYIEGFSIADTARVMARTSASIKALQHRAKKRLLTLIRNEVKE